MVASGTATWRKYDQATIQRNRSVPLPAMYRTLVLAGTNPQHDVQTTQPGAATRSFLPELVEQGMAVNSYEYILHSNLIEGVKSQAEIDQSLKAWEFLIGQDKLTMDVVLETHRLMMEKQWSAIGGKMRRENVQVGKYYAPHYMHLPFMMRDWISDMENAILPEFRHMRDYSPMVMHIRFEQIHPFRDGNGRSGRMFMWWHELKTGKTPTLIEYKDRWSYYDWF